MDNDIISPKSTFYVHADKCSFQSQAIQTIAGFFGAKKNIQNKINKHDFGHKSKPAPKRLLSNFNVAKNDDYKHPYWTIEPLQNHSSSNKIVLYLHGGAYLWGISKRHWDFVKDISQSSNATLIIPDYPLAPESTSTKIYHYIDRLYSDLSKKYKTDNITIIGDSAGGGLTLGFSMYLRNRQIPQPKQIILLSPWLDVTMSNKDISTIDPKDKIMNTIGLQMAGDLYAGEANKLNYQISPIYGELSDLPSISLFIGTHDLLLADSRKLIDKLKTVNTTFNYYEYPKMFHDWMLIPSLKESKSALNQIVSLLKY